MTAFSKADVQNVRLGVELNVRFWPKADVQIPSMQAGALLSMTTTGLKVLGDIIRSGVTSSQRKFSKDGVV